MKFHSQILHIVRYDLRRMQWWWLLYLATVSTTLFSPVGDPAANLLDIDQSWLFISPLFVPVVAVLLTISIAQGESPFDQRAFLRGKPFSPNAEMSAKLLQLSVLVLGTLALFLFGLLRARLSWADALLSVGTVSLSFVCPVLGAVNIGAVAKSLSNAVLLCLAVMLAMFLLQFLQLSWYWTFIRPVSAVLCVALFWWFHRNSIGRRTATTGAIALSAVGFSGQCAGAGWDVAPKAPVEGMAERVAFDALPVDRLESNGINYKVENARNDRLYVLDRVSVGVDGVVKSSSSGRSVILTNSNWLAATEPEITATMLPGIGSLSVVEGTNRPLSADEGMILGDFRANARSGDGNELVLTGALRRYHAELVVERPFRLGELHSDSIATVTLRQDSGQLVVDVRGLSRNLPNGYERPGVLDPSDWMTLVLVDSTTSSARILRSNGRLTSDAPYVLPYLMFGQRREQFEESASFAPLIGKRGVAARVYRWVEDGRAEIKARRAVKDWPRRPETGSGHVNELSRASAVPAK